MKKTETNSIVLLAHHLNALKMPAILAEWGKVASQCASDNVDHLRFLLQLCELELLERERKTGLGVFKQHTFPIIKPWTPLIFQPSSRSTRSRYRN